MAKSDWKFTIVIEAPVSPDSPLDDEDRPTMSETFLVDDPKVRAWTHPGRQLEFREWLGKRIMDRVKTLLDPAAEAHRLEEIEAREAKEYAKRGNAIKAGNDARRG